ncbi:MAG: DUF3800 domain-containing protein [Oscillospiraceae bacterium]|nr:DUF3800 domain-containing protein [Oscillospiraceae bacterium]MDY2848427.1 DUF3800 domain-containing protein [Oscillospiraceae bacterium]
MAAFIVIGGVALNIFVYSDESGVFDKVHNDVFVFGGLIFLDKSSKDIYCRKYAAAENVIYSSGTMKKDQEIKAARISNKEKNKLYRSLNKCYKFGIVINEKKVLDRIFDGKKDKQRYLDYAYKIGIKRAFQSMITDGLIYAGDVENIYFYVDEHTTATNGRYELREALELELKNGTYNLEYSCYYKPLFSKVKNVDVRFCNSASVTLVRAADIVANKVYHISLSGNDFTEEINSRHMYITKLP